MPRKPARHGTFRDALIVAGVLALAGVALADAVRGDGDSDGAPAAATEPADSVVVEDPLEPLRGVPAGGSLVFLDDDGCALRQIVVSGGQELPLPRIETGCELWAAPRGGLVAYALDGPYGEFRPFRLVDLAHPDEPLGTYQTFTGVTWSLDGQRASWCHEPGRGYDLAVRSREEPRRLRGCPIAYAPGARPAFAEGDRLLVDGETAFRASGAIRHAAWGRDGSLAVVLDGGRLERVVDGEPVSSVLGVSANAPPVLAPDSCDAAYPSEGGRIELWGLCHGAETAGTVEGTAAAWSPDGQWLAVASGEEIVFHHLSGTLGTRSWPIRARALAWVR